MSLCDATYIPVAVMTRHRFSCTIIHFPPIVLHVIPCFPVHPLLPSFPLLLKWIVVSHSAIIQPQKHFHLYLHLQLMRFFPLLPPPQRDTNSDHDLLYDPPLLPSPLPLLTRP